MRPRFISAVALFAVIASAVPSWAETIAVIVNRDNARQALSIEEIRRVYTNSVLEWPDGTPVTLYDLSLQDPLRSFFSEKVLGKPSSKIAQEWAHLKITNQAKNPPLEIKSETLIIKRVAREKGAIGYVSAASVKNAEGVVIVNILQ